MQKGFNSDISYRGRSYHVQTEDWGAQNPFLVTRIFQNGAVVLTVKKSYSEIPGFEARKINLIIQQALRQQHSEMISQLLAGEIF